MAGRLCVGTGQTRIRQSCLQRIQFGGSDGDNRVPGKKKGGGGGGVGRAVEVQRWEPNSGRGWTLSGMRECFNRD